MSKDEIETCVEYNEKVFFFRSRVVLLFVCTCTHLSMYVSIYFDVYVHENIHMLRKDPKDPPSPSDNCLFGISIKSGTAFKSAAAQGCVNPKPISEQPRAGSKFSSDF